jgi:anaerobic magnesium-protoporphyrin IX monomethyl ester cyclase
MRVALVDTFGAFTHSSLALRYLRAYALADARLASCADIRICSLPLASLSGAQSDAAAATRTLEEITAFRPDILGISCYVWNVHELVGVSALLKACLPDLTVIAGGPEVSSPELARKLLDHAPHISHIVRGEGEIPFRGLLRHLADGIPRVDEIRGLAHRSAGGHAVIGMAADALADLNDIPSPYPAGDLPSECDFYLLETYRGCPNRCRYCTWSRKPHRRFALERVLAELDTLLRAGARYIYVIDSVFGPDRPRADRIIDFILEQGKARRRLPGFLVFPDTAVLDDGYARRLRRANCDVSFGLQSTNLATLARAGRHLDPDRFRSALAAANRHFQRYDVDLIYGLPGDTCDDFLASFNWLADLDPPEIHCHPLAVLPGSEFHEEAPVHGLAFDAWPPHEVRSTPALSAAETAGLGEFSRAVDWLYNQATLAFRLLQRRLGVPAAELIQDFLAWRERHPSHTGSEDGFDVLALYLDEKAAPLPGARDAVRAALAFDRACHECYKQFYFGCPRERFSVAGLPSDWETARPVSTSAGRSVRILSLPTEVASLLHSEGTEDHPSGACHYAVHRYGYTRLDGSTRTLLEAVIGRSRTLAVLAVDLGLTQQEARRGIGMLLEEGLVAVQPAPSL